MPLDVKDFDRIVTAVSGVLAPTIREAVAENAEVRASALRQSVSDLLDERLSAINAAIDKSLHAANANAMQLVSELNGRITSTLADAEKAASSQSAAQASAASALKTLEGQLRDFKEGFERSLVELRGSIDVSLEGMRTGISGEVSELRTIAHDTRTALQTYKGEVEQGVTSLRGSVDKDITSRVEGLRSEMTGVVKGTSDSFLARVSEISSTVDAARAEIEASRLAAEASVSALRVEINGSFDKSALHLAEREKAAAAAVEECISAVRSEATARTDSLGAQFSTLTEEVLAQRTLASEETRKTVSGIAEELRCMVEGAEASGNAAHKAIDEVRAAVNAAAALVDTKVREASDGLGCRVDALEQSTARSGLDLTALGSELREVHGVAHSAHVATQELRTMLDGVPDDVQRRIDLHTNPLAAETGKFLDTLEQLKLELAEFATRGWVDTSLTKLKDGTQDLLMQLRKDFDEALGALPPAPVLPDFDGMLTNAVQGMDNRYGPLLRGTQENITSEVEKRLHSFGEARTAAEDALLHRAGELVNAAVLRAQAAAQAAANAQGAAEGAADTAAATVRAASDAAGATVGAAVAALGESLQQHFEDKLKGMVQDDVIIAVDATVNELKGRLEVSLKEFLFGVVAAMPKPRDGEKGDKGDKGDRGDKGDKGDKGVKGDDGLIATPVPYVEDKTYERGTWVTFKSGVWVAARSTGAIPHADSADWDCIVPGVDKMEAVVAADGRSVDLHTQLSNGATHSARFKLAVPVARGVYDKETVYSEKDIATYDGSWWEALKDGKLPAPGTDKSAWRLTIKHGKDGKDSKNTPAAVIRNLGEWVLDVEYPANVIVSHAGVNWLSVRSTRERPPFATLKSNDTWIKLGA